MANRNPFGADTADYGTVSGQSSGFGGGGGGGDGSNDFQSMKEKASDLVMAIKKTSRDLRIEENKLGTSSDTEQFRRRLQNILRETMGKVERCKAILIQLNQISINTGDRGQVLAVKSLQQSLTSVVNGFQTVLQDITRSMESNDIFRSDTPQSLVMSDTAELGEHSDTARLVRGGGRGGGGLPQQQQQVLMVSDGASHLEERAERMEGLESDILTLNEIMGDIAHLVHEQGEQIDTIDGNVEAAYSDVIHGNQQLEKGVRLKKCSRKLTCIIVAVVGGIFAVIILIIIIAVAILADQKKKAPN